MYVWDFIFWIGFAVLITIVLMYIIAQIYIYFWEQYWFNLFEQQFNNYCATIPLIIYREEVYVPKKAANYEKKLATALVDISYAVSSANCTNILPIPNPPGLDQQLRVEGTNPIDGSSTMYAYIFYSKKSGTAVIAFTGTESTASWKLDLMFNQVAPTALNGYVEGVLCHNGFYQIYLAVRQTLWNWYHDNEIWIRNLFITGHSLGGALSSLCAYDFAAFNPITYSFGSPRVGNNDFATYMALRVPQNLRINNTEDIVTNLPLAAWQDTVYDSVAQNVVFTASLGSLQKNHIDAYTNDLPECSQVSKCNIKN